MVIVSVLIACLYKAPEDISVKNTAMHLFLKGLSNKIFLSFAPVILEILISRLELIPLILISFATIYFLAKLVTFELVGDETTGCKKYNNGYMELWSESKEIFKFIIPFKDTNYKCIVSRLDNVALNSGYDSGIKITEKTTTSIKIDTVCGGNPKVNCRILCQGYWK